MVNSDDGPFHEGMAAFGGIRMNVAASILVARLTVLLTATRSNMRFVAFNRTHQLGAARVGSHRKANPIHQEQG